MEIGDRSPILNCDSNARCMRHEQHERASGSWLLNLGEAGS